MRNVHISILFAIACMFTTNGLLNRYNILLGQQLPAEAFAHARIVSRPASALDTSNPGIYLEAGDALSEYVVVVEIPWRPSFSMSLAC